MSIAPVKPTPIAPVKKPRKPRHLSSREKGASPLSVVARLDTTTLDALTARYSTGGYEVHDHWPNRTTD